MIPCTHHLIRDFTTYSMWVANDWDLVETHGRTLMAQVGCAKKLTVQHEESAKHAWREAMVRYKTSRALLSTSTTLLTAAGVDISIVPTHRLPNTNGGPIR